MAEICGIPYVSYQRAEHGDIPQGPNLSALAAGLGVQESDLFVDFERFSRKGPVGPRDALETLMKLVEQVEAASPERRKGYHVIDSFTPVELKVFLREHGSLFESDEEIE